MAHNKETSNQNTNKSQNSTSNANSVATTTTTTNKKGATPMIVARVNKIPIVSVAVSMGFSQYDKLKSSNVTVGDVMTRAESWAFYVWQKMQPIVEKLRDPINKADQLACNTLDFLEGKLNTVLPNNQTSTA